MVKILSRAFLKRQLTQGNLKKVGRVNLQGGKENDVEAGTYQGAKLKAALGTISAGKSKSLLEKKLREHGLTGSQIDKRKAIMDLVFKNKNKSPEKGKMVEINGKKVFMSQAKINRNLSRAELDRGGVSNKRLSGVKFSGGRALVTSGAVADRKISGAGHIAGSVEKLGVKKQSAGFALQGVNKDKPAGNSLPPPSRGTRPIDL